ncbi:3D domain-containing protein [Bacillus sp. H1a]|uniref:3D domain-containing protein n=1 Tax=Bacillus sp. H1a TaxID=1397276 RepID=UPI0004692EFD|nr:3D domain-containing protein [Bacillus sp. H1a]
MKKQIAVFTLVTTLGLSIQPIVSSAETAQNTQAAQQSGWVQEENGKWFFYENGAKKTGWFALNGKWYYLDPNEGGAMKIGWAQVEGKWFYLNPNEGGAMKTGWEKVEGKWYYLDPTTDGSMKTGWFQDNGKWYYLNANEGGAAKIGWVQVEGKWYYFDGNDGAAMKTGWFQENGKWYYLNANEGGAAKIGWEKVDGKWYYFDGSDGAAMKTGWFQENNQWYYLDASGVMVNGWTRIDGKMNYFQDNGQWINTRELTVTSTAYTNDPTENGYKPGQHVYTKMGDDLTANPDLKVIAVDPSVIPLESKVYVEGYGIAEARDTGGAIRGNKIDVFIPSKQESSNWGRKTVKIYVLPKN